MAIGAYGGIYACQNYNVPRVDDPQALLERIKEYLKQYEKPKQTTKTHFYYRNIK